MAPLSSVSAERDDDTLSISKAGDFTSLAKSMHFNIQVKLDNNNYTQWKAQVFPVIKAFQLEDYVLNDKSIPPKHIEASSTNEGDRQQVLNKEYIT